MKADIIFLIAEARGDEMQYFMKIFLAVVFNIFLFAGLSHAEKVTFVKEYTYQASELDSKHSSRTISLEMVKRLLLEEFGTYLINETEVKDFKLTKDQITILSAGIVSAEIINEKWDGKTYWLKAKVSADPAEVAKSLDRLSKDSGKIKEMETTLRDANKKADEALKEIERLKKELVVVKTTKREKQGGYTKLVSNLSAKELLERGIALSNSGKTSEAIDALSKAIELNPEERLTYFYRGLEFNRIKDFQKALNDLNKMIDLDPQDAFAFGTRALVYTGMGDYDNVLNDYSLAISKNPASVVDLSSSYSGRGLLYITLKKYDEAIIDYTKAIEIDPRNKVAYIGRALAYKTLGEYHKAIEDCDRAIFVNPQFEYAYYVRSALNAAIGNKEKSMQDLKSAAKFGNEKAQKMLKALGIDWMADSKADTATKSEISKESPEKYLYNPQPYVLQKVEYDNFLFELKGCKSVDNSITCDLVITNKDDDRVLGISNDIYLLKTGIFVDKKTRPTRIVDTFGNEYRAKLIQFGGKKEERPQTLLVKNISARAVLIFEKISPLPDKLSILEIGLFDGSNKVINLRFQDIPVHGMKE